MSYQGSGNAYLAGARYAGRVASQDRRAAASAREIEAAEQAYDDARAAYEAEVIVPGQPRPAWEAFKAARDALCDIDPDNYRFS